MFICLPYMTQGTCNIKFKILKESSHSSKKLILYWEKSLTKSILLSNQLFFISYISFSLANIHYWRSPLILSLHYASEKFFICWSNDSWAQEKVSKYQKANLKVKQNKKSPLIVVFGLFWTMHLLTSAKSFYTFY